MSSGGAQYPTMMINVSFLDMFASMRFVKCKRIIFDYRRICIDDVSMAAFQREGDMVGETGERRDWSEHAKGILRAELKRRNLTYAQLVDALSSIGVSESEANLRNKISRGNFSAVFMLQCLDAIGVHMLILDPERMLSGEPGYPRDRKVNWTKAPPLGKFGSGED